MLKQFVRFGALLTVLSCAVIKSPTGGEKDISPPQVVSVKPLMASLNYHKSSVDIRFDEFIESKDFAKEILVSPKIKTLKSKYTGKGVKLSWDEQLKPNTTYNFQFLNSIVDYNEKNILAGYQFTFSTGDILDSLSVFGEIINQSLEPSKELSVQLIENSLYTDSSFIKSEFNFSTFSQQDGHFNFSYLPQNEFRVFGFEDLNANNSWDEVERLAFSSQIINSSDSAHVDFVLFTNEKNPKFTRVKHTGYNILELDYVTELPDTSEMLLISNGVTIPFSGRDMGEHFEILFNEELIGDSLTVLINKDTLPAYTTSYKKQKINLELDKTIVLTNQPILFNSNYPLQGIDTSNIVVVMNGDSLLNFRAYILENQYQVGIEYAETEFPINIHFQDSALVFQDSIHNKKSIEKVIKYSSEDLATIQCTFKKHEYPLIVELLSDDNELLKQVYLSESETTLSFKNLLSGQYKVRYIIDANKDGRFTSGRIEELRQPEQIINYSQAIQLKPNWVTELLF